MRQNSFRVVIRFVVVRSTEIAHVVDYISQAGALSSVRIIGFRVGKERRDGIRDTRMHFEDPYKNNNNNVNHSRSSIIATFRWFIRFKVKIVPAEVMVMTTQRPNKRMRNDRRISTTWNKRGIG